MGSITVKYQKTQKEMIYWKQRCLFMESMYAPDSNDFFDASEIKDLQDDFITEFAGIPYLGIFLRWNKKSMARNQLQQIRDQKGWHREN